MPIFSSRNTESCQRPRDGLPASTTSPLHPGNVCVKPTVMRLLCPYSPLESRARAIMPLESKGLLIGSFPVSRLSFSGEHVSFPPTGGSVRPFRSQVNMVVGPAKITPPIPNILDRQSHDINASHRAQNKTALCLRGKQRAVSFLCHLFAVKGPETA